MAYDIGTARGVIEMEYNGRGIDEAKQDLAGLENTGKRSTTGLNNAANTMGKMGLVIAAGLGAGVMAAANFEQRIDAIGAVSGATASELDAISAKALQLGRDTAFSASESAQAMEELIKAGLSVDDVLNGAADATVALAAAGSVDMPTAATIASNAMNQFNLSAEDMVGVADAVAGAANASAIDVTDFGQSLSQVGAVANLAGVSFKDTATAIALLGNAGIKGSDAGTSLKSMFSRLQPVTAKQTALFKELGIITADGSNKFYDQQGNLKDLASVSGVLQKSLAGMTKQQKQATLQTLFGSDAIRAAAILADNGSKGFDKMAASMDKVKAADVAKQRMDNLKGSLEELMGSLETLGITLGTILIPPITAIVDALTQMLNKFLELDSGTQKWIVGLAAGAATLLLVAAGIIKFIVFIARLQAALTVLRGTMIATWLAALGPIGLIIAAIALVVAAIVILWNKSETFRSIVIGIWNAIKAAAMAVAQWFMGTLVPFFQNIWNTISNAVRAAWNIIITVIRTYMTIVMTVIRTALTVLRAIWNAVWGTFGPLVRAVWNLIVAIIRLAWTIIKGVVLAAINVLRGTVQAGFNAIRSVVQVVMSAIRGVIQAVWGFIGPYVMGVVNAIRSGISNAWNTVRSITSSVFGALSGIVSRAIDAVMSIISGLASRVTAALSGAGTWLYSKGQDIIQGLIDGITSMIDKVTGAIGSVTSKIGDMLPGSPVKEGPLRVLNHGYAGKQIVGMMIEGVEAMAGPLSDAFSNAVALPDPAMAALPVGATPTPPRDTRGGDRRRERLIDGELRLDRSGRAFIRGVAVDADDDNEDYNDTLGRMN